MRSSAYVWLVGCFCLTACASDPAPLPPIDLSAAQCAATPDLGNALDLSLADQQGNLKKSAEMNANFDEQSPCLLEDGGARGLYAVIRLPQIAQSYTISVASAALTDGSMAPLRLSMLDAGGRQTRGLSGDRFLFRGQQLTAQLRSHQGEEFLLVMTDSSRTGQNVTRISTTARVDMVAAGPVLYARHDFMTREGFRLG